MPLQHHPSSAARDWAQVELDAGEGALLQRVMTSLARAVRLARSKGDQAGAGVDAALFEQAEEAALHRAVQDVRTQVAGNTVVGDGVCDAATQPRMWRASVAMSTLCAVLLIFWGHPESSPRRCQRRPRCPISWRLLDTSLVQWMPSLTTSSSWPTMKASGGTDWPCSGAASRSSAGICHWPAKRNLLPRTFCHSSLLNTALLCCAGLLLSCREASATYLSFQASKYMTLVLTSEVFILDWNTITRLDAVTSHGQPWTSGSCYGTDAKAQTGMTHLTGYLR